MHTVRNSIVATACPCNMYQWVVSVEKHESCYHSIVSATFWDLMSVSCQVYCEKVTF